MSVDRAPGRTDVAEAARLVVARLGRRPQDALEAAVVLEAWGGVPAPRSLELGASVVSVVPAEDATSTMPVEPAPRPGPSRSELVAVGIGTVAVALFVPSLVRDLGRDVVEQAGTLAFPLTAGVGWALLRPGGRTRLYRMRPPHPAVLPAMVLSVAGVATATFGTAGLVATCLFLAWSSVTVLARLGSGRKVTAVVAGASLAAMSLPAAPLLVGVSLLGVAIAVVRLQQLPATRDATSAWLSTLTATLVGATLGWLVGSDAAGRTSGDLPSLVVWAPPAVGVLWAVVHLRELRQVVPIDPWSAPSGRDAARVRPLRVLSGAVVRLVAATAAGSLLLVQVAALRGGDLSPLLHDLRRAALLGGVALFAMLLDALGRGSRAIPVVAVAAVSDAVARAGADGPADEFAWLLVGGGLALAVGAGATLELLGRGDRMTPALLIR